MDCVLAIAATVAVVVGCCARLSSIRRGYYTLLFIYLFLISFSLFSLARFHSSQRGER